MSKDNLKEELTNIDEQIAKLKNEIAMGEALDSLHEDERFKLIMTEGYFDEEEKRISGLLFNPTALKREQLENLMDKTTAIRNTKQYYNTIQINANMAPAQIEEEEAYRKRLTSEASIIEE
jgi:hypothetical protein